MQTQFSRTQMLLGAPAMRRLAQARVAVFGVGGVGGAAAEAIVRGGVGAIDIIDSDKVSLTNLNRQIVATHATLDQYKVDALAARLSDINPHASIRAHRLFFLPEHADAINFSNYDYVIDAVDTVKAKIGIVMSCAAAGVPVISAMGAGNKLDATGFRVADIYETKVCPLARVMRKELKAREIQQLKVVYSEEAPRAPIAEDAGDADGMRRAVPGSTSFVPPVVGMILAGEVIKDIAQETK
ncbi:MAG: tRNA threonylcarbamoyladenosine dehydratase [Christensenellales bacterium]|jgi:tRNA A37 threonylcarbamoyladenosine dehydratase